VAGIVMGIVAGIVACIIASIMGKEVEESLKTGRLSWLTRGGFGVLLLAYAFFIWFSFLGGWRVFQ
jgi:predicted lysophospholipase L1 biosynthesis ABC-type transport system permease subunit